MLERGGLNRKSIQRIANQVYSNGYPIERTKGRLRKWMYKISKSNPSAQNLRIYGDKLYIFSNDVLITVFNIPNNLKKDLAKMMIRRIHMAAANKKQERISAVRFVHYFSDKHPHGTLAVSGENFKGTFCRLIPCKIDAEGKKYGNYHNHILYMETRNLVL